MLKIKMIPTYIAVNKTFSINQIKPYIYYEGKIDRWCIHD